MFHKEEEHEYIVTDTDVNCVTVISERLSILDNHSNILDNHLHIFVACQLQACYFTNWARGRKARC